MGTMQPVKGTEYMGGSTKATSACSVLCTAGNIKSGGRDPFSVESELFNFASFNFFIFTIYALRATSSLEVDFHFLLVATLGGLSREPEFGTCIFNRIYISIYNCICLCICEFKKIHFQLVATIVAGGMNQNLEPG